MKYLVALFLLAGCGIMEKSKDVKVTRDAKLINCTKQFLGKYLTGNASYRICKDIYRRGE